MSSGFRLSGVASSFRPRRFLAAYLLVWLWLTAAFGYVLSGQLYPSPLIVAMASAVCLAYLTLFGIPAYCLLLISGRRTMLAYCAASLLASLPMIAVEWYGRRHFWVVLYLAVGLESGLIAHFVIEPMRRVPQSVRLRRAAGPAAGRSPGIARSAPGWRAASLLWLAAPVVAAMAILTALDRFSDSGGRQWVQCKAPFDISQAREAERTVMEVAGRWGLAAEVDDFDDWTLPPVHAENLFLVDVRYDRGFFRQNDRMLLIGSWPGDGTVLTLNYWFHPPSDEDAPDVDAVPLARDAMRTLEQRFELSFRYSHGPHSASREDEKRYCSSDSDPPRGETRFSGASM